MTVIPNVNDASVLEAAQLYADAGLYVGPLAAGTKHPGSVLGKGWQHQTSRDPDQIAEWFADTDYGVFIHCGRSGLIVIDVDYLDKLPAVLADNLDGVPHQSTRPDQPGRGHYLFAQPAGRRYGNGAGRLGSAWGDIRGANGVIVAAPSQHGGGGEYRWLTTGVVPELPAAIGEQLTEPARSRTSGSDEAADAVSDAAVQAFLDEHTEASRPGALAGRVKGFREHLAAGNGRHTGVGGFLVGAIEEAAAGLYSAEAVVDEIGSLFVDAVVADGSRSPGRAHAEFLGYLAWAIGQAEVADLDAVRARVADAMGADGEAAFEDVLRNAGKGSRSADGSAKPGLRLRWASELAPAAPLKWLARGRIPLSAVTLLTGDEGIGKSLLWVWIAAAVSTGRAVPEFGIPAREPRHVVIIVTEDSWSGVARARLELAGANMAYIRLLCEDDNGTGSPSFPRDIDLVRSADPPPYLVVVDAWADALDAGLTVKDAQHARQALHPWSETADKLGAAVILLTHTNRGTGTSIRERYAMTSELRKKARMTLFAQQDEDGNLVVGPDKSNLSGKANASVFAVEVVKVFDETDDSDGTIGRVVYVGDAGRTAAELLADLSTVERESEATRAMSTVQLSAILADRKPHPVKAVLEQMEAAGVSKRSTQRAASKLGVLVDTHGFGSEKRSTWQLPPSAPSSAPSSEGVTHGTNGTDGGDGNVIDFPCAPNMSNMTPTGRGEHGGAHGDSEPNDTVEKPSDLDPNGWPLCAGGCGLGINPALGIGDRHEFCS